MFKFCSFAKNTIMQKKITSLLIIVIFTSQFLTAQNHGINNDPYSKGKGKKPYEMAERTEDRKPFIDFEDCTKWIVETENAEAKLYRTDEKPLFKEYTGKLVYTPTSKKCEITIKPEKPVEINYDWDCIDFWNYGDHWLWGKPEWQTALRQYVLIEDAAGKLHEIDFTQAGYEGMVHKYWFMNHIKLNGEIKLPAKFAGIRFKGRHAVTGQEFVIYLGPVYIYKEVLKPLNLKDCPDTLPFPTRKETILPLNKEKVFTNSVELSNDKYIFSYSDDITGFSYELKPEDGLLNSLILNYKGKTIHLAKDAKIKFSDDKKAQWKITEKVLKNDTLFVNATNITGNNKFKFWFTINQKSFIFSIEETGTTGNVSEIDLGNISESKGSKHIIVPFLIYGSGRIPRILYSDGLFFFKQVDWYYSNASDIIERKNRHGVKYIPKTNGVRNPVKEKFFINVSEDVQEVLPTIANPKSPMRSMMADRLWMIDGSDNYPEIKEYVKLLRALGLQQVAVRYHEGFWRDEGESYTFRTETAPGRGGDTAVQNLVEYIKDRGWLTGLYSNYTDFAPVNANWNPDWVKRGPNGEWEVSWSRCYAPKPVIAREQEAYYAPLIHKKFGTNFSYCDVHTAVSPIARVDYDYRVPGAATFRKTFECYGLLLLNEKKSYHGPVYSEGNYQCFYAGLTDGNYANFALGLNKIPVFPDFQLLKIHPLEMDAGNVYAEKAEYIAYTLAYGNIGIINSGSIGKSDDDLSERIRRYAILQPLQKYYSMVPVKSIRYFDNGEYYNSSEAIKKELIKKPKLALEYKSGLKVFINFSDKIWEIEKSGNKYYLPKYGYLAYLDSAKVLGFYGKSDLIKSDTNIYFSKSGYQYYFDTNGDTVETENFKLSGKIFLKLEKFGWEIIPARDFDFFSFNPKILGYENKIQIEGLNINDRPVDEVNFTIENGKVFFKHKNKKVLKYRISPL